MVFGCECIPHLSPMTHNEQDTHESFGVALIMVMSFVDLSSPKSPLAFVVTVNDCAFKIVILLLVSLSSLLNTPRKMHKSKLSQNFYTIGRNNEAKSLSSNLEMVLSEQYYYQGSSTDGVIFSKKKHNLIICKHDGGSSYLMGLVTNGSFVSILGNGNDFSVTVKNREITVISTAPYWYVLLI